MDLVKAAPAGEKVAVIFDGEKRQTAYETFQLVRTRIAFAAFDDTNLDDGAFPQLLRDRGEDAWHTWDCAYMKRHSDAAPLSKLDAKLREASAPVLQRAEAASTHLKMRRDIDAEGRLVFHGGMEDLSRFHTTLVMGGAPPAQAALTN